MGFLRSSWYCAGWSKDLAEKPVGRKILGDYLVIYQGERGQVIASAGQCPRTARAGQADPGRRVRAAS